MMRPEHEALIQGAIDGTLTEDEREAYRRLMAESAEAQNRAAELEKLSDAIESLGQAEAPPSLARGVAAQISPRAWADSSRRTVSINPKRGIAVDKKLIFGLAAAAVVVLAVITYTTYPPATDGTEATIGAAQRGQAPQIAPQDVALGDASAQEFLQSELFDELINDEATRAMLLDNSLRQNLTNVDLRKALEDQAVRQSLSSPELKKLLDDPEMLRRLEDLNAKKFDDANVIKRFDDANLRQAVRNDAFLRALRIPAIRMQLANARWAEAMARTELAKAVQARGFEAAMRKSSFAQEMARAEARVAARGNARK